MVPAKKVFEEQYYSKDQSTLISLTTNMHINHIKGNSHFKKRYTVALLSFKGHHWDNYYKLGMPVQTTMAGNHVNNQSSEEGADSYRHVPIPQYA